MKRLNTNVGSTNAALEKAPEVLKAIGVNHPIDVLDGMVHHAVRVIRFQSLIGEQQIGIDVAASLDMLADFSLQNLFLATRDNRNANFAAALKDADDSHLVFGSRPGDPTGLDTQVHIPSLATDEGFVHFDASATLAAQLHHGAVLHCLADAVKHEPCRLLSDAQGAGNLAGANAVLRSGDNPDSGKPLIQTERGILEDRSHLRGELALGMAALALPFLLGCKVGNILASACGALDAFGPTVNNHVLKAVIRIREVNDSVLQCLWPFHVLRIGELA